MQQSVQIAYHFLDGVLGRAGVAPPQAGAIVGANARLLGDFRLYERPINGECTSPDHQDDSRSSFARAVHVQLATTNID
jgi:hypothetical protein